MRWIALYALLLIGCDDGASKDAAVTCTDVDGHEHQPGDTWDDADGCNTCTCQDDGTVSCTDLGCL